MLLLLLRLWMTKVSFHLLMVMMMVVVSAKFPSDPFPVPSGFLRFVALLALLRQSTAAAAAVGQFVVIVSTTIIIIAFFAVLVGLLGDSLNAKNFILRLKVCGTASVLAEAST